MSTHLKNAVATLGAFLAASGVHAAVTDYGLSKAAGYAQTSNSDPTTPVGYAVVAQVGGALTDYSSATVTGGSSALDFDNVPGYSLEVFATKVALDAAIPNGTTYTFALSGGTYNGQSATLATLASDAFPSVVPYLTGGTYSSLQNANAAAPIDLKFNAASQVLIESTSGGVVYDAFTGGATAELVAANTLAAGTTYNVYLYDVGGTATSGGFGGATGTMDYENFTQISLTTAPVPEPAMLWFLASGLLVIAARHRKTDRP